MNILIEFSETTKNNIDWLQVATLLAAIFVPLIVAWIGYKEISKNFQNKVMEKRLSKIYAPAYSYLIKQEKLRELYGFTDALWDLKNVPILSISSSKITITLNSETSKTDTTSSIGIIHTDHLVSLINNYILPNCEFASPNLLNIVNSYLIVLEYEKKYQKQFENNPIVLDAIKTISEEIPNSITKANDLTKEIEKLVARNLISPNFLSPNFIIYYNATTQKVRLENGLIIEIIEGYQDCLTSLSLMNKKDKKSMLTWPK